MAEISSNQGTDQRIPTQVQLNKKLIKAAKIGDTASVLILLQSGAEVHARDERGTDAALRCAAEKGHLEMVNLLIEHGAKVCASMTIVQHEEDISDAPIVMAACNGRLEVVKLLLNYGGSLPLALCVSSAAGKINIVKALVEYDGEVDLNEALSIAVENGQHRVVRLLLDKGADITTVNGDPLLVSVAANDLTMLKLLLERGADVHSASSYYGTEAALIFAAESGHAGAVKILLEFGADVHAQSPIYGGDAALKAAARWGHTDTVKLLLENGADLHAVSLYDESEIILMEAVRNENIEIVRVLLSFGANAKTTSFMRSPLVEAAELGNQEIAELLIEHGADVHGPNKSAQALWFALRRGYHALAGQLLKHESIDLSPMLITMADEYLPTALEFLLLHGADPHASLFSDKDEALRRARSSDKKENASFLRLATEILDCGVADDRLAALSSYTGRFIPKLQNDSIKAAEWKAQPVVRCMLRSALICAVLVPNADENTLKRIFQGLTGQDIYRIEHTKDLTWQRYGQFISEHLTGIGDIKDVVAEVAEAIIYPMVMLKGNMPPDFSPEMAKDIAGEVIAGEKSTLDFGVLSRKWHKAGNRLPDAMRPYKMIGGWYPLFEGEVSLGGGLSAICLCSPKELEEEGRILDHCVGAGSYASACQSGETHIVSIRQDGLPIATMELRKVQCSNPESALDHWQTIQFRGPCNRMPSLEAKHAWQCLRIKVKTGSVYIGYEVGITQEGERDMSRLSEFARYTGFELEDAAQLVPQFLKHYEDRVYVQRKNGTRTPLINQEHLLKVLERLSHHY